MSTKPLRASPTGRSPPPGAATKDHKVPSPGASRRPQSQPSPREGRTKTVPAHLRQRESQRARGHRASPVYTRGKRGGPGRCSLTPAQRRWQPGTTLEHALI